LQLEKLFMSFDEDGSNTLDVKELHDMFQSNGVYVSLEQCMELFKIVDEDGSGMLSVEEFKLFLQSDEANEMFRQLIKELRGNAQLIKQPDGKDWTDNTSEIWDSIREKPRVPYNLNVLLEGMSLKNSRIRLLEQINKNKPTINPDITLDTLDKYLMLF
jgi:hypothetical protein